MLTWPCVTIEWNTPPIHDGRGQRCFVGREMAARAQQMPVRPQHPQLFRAQNDVTICAMEERQQRAVLIALLVPPGARERRAQRIVAEVARAKDAARR